MATQRIYRVFDTEINGKESDRLIEATGRAQAINYVVRDRYSAEPASARDVARLMAEGVVVESAAKIEAAQAGGE